MRLTAVIVDDEPVAVRRMARLLAAIPDVAVVGGAASGAEARELIDRLRPDILFADIEMPGETGLRMAESMHAEAGPIVIFVTAFGEYALDAFGLDSADYLLKPVEHDRVVGAVERARKRVVARGVQGREEEFRRVVAALRDRLAGKGDGASIWIRDRQGGVRLPLSSVFWLEADRDYVRLHTDARRYLVRGRLSAFEGRLSSSTFVRVHRSAIVQRTVVREVRTTGDRAFTLTLCIGDVVPVSRVSPRSRAVSCTTARCWTEGRGMRARSDRGRAAAHPT